MLPSPYSRPSGRAVRDHPYVTGEMAEIQAAVNSDLELDGGRRTLSQILRECAAPGVRNRILKGAIMMLLQNFTGFVPSVRDIPTVLTFLGSTRSTTTALQSSAL